jgi:dTDP-glucose pyrophosphorylase
LKNWTEILLKPSSILETTIQVLHSGGARIALVVDSNRKLLGTVTDGDIRRALISQVDMDCSVEKVMNNNPVTALTSQSSDVIMLLMKNKGLLHIPLLNEDGVLVGLKMLQDIVENNRYDNPVFLMAGGFGTRLRPLTNTKPKPLLNVGKQPILETIITQFIDAGFHNFYISVHYKAEMIADYFGDGSDWGVTIRYVHEGVPLGTAGSLGLLPKNITQLPVIMMNGDLLTKVNFENLLDFHCQNNNIATMCVREYDFQVPYGVVDIKEHCITKIVEKPVQKFFVNAGIYVLSHELIKHIDGYSYLDMPNFIQTQIDKGSKVNVFPIHEYWLDIGRIEEYEKANLEVMDLF